MREVIFEGLKWYITPVEATADSNKRKRRRKKIEKEEGLMSRRCV
jgi:hypothetical protein